MSDGINWEAAKKAYKSIADLAARAGDYTTDQEIIKAVVKAALGDEPKYEEPVEFCNHFYIGDQGICISCKSQLRWVRQVWPEVTE